MEMPSLLSLDGLTDLRLRGGVDMRPTLIRVLTDLYVQKLSHTADEEQHYTELALRLLDGVDVPTRAAVATRLARHLAPPVRVMQYLVNDLPEVAAALRNQTTTTPAVRPIEPATAAQPVAAIGSMAALTAVEEVTSLEPEEAYTAPDEEEPDEQAPVAASPGAIDAATAGELNEFFFDASEYERRLILLNLHVAAPLSPGRVALRRDPAVGERLEAAVLGNHRDDFVKHLADALHIAREQARRIARDDRGEPLVVAVKALGIPRDVVYRILIFANPAVGHSVERVHTLATLFDEMTAPAAEGMVAIWQSMRKDERSTAKHQPLFFDDERARARPQAAARRLLATPRSSVRREVS
jgi:hypothetical protein